MSDENTENQEVNETPQETPQDEGGAEPTQMGVEDALNLLVGIARNSRLTYQEHKTVDTAVEVLLKALNN
jgi:hypothetical protein